MAVGAFIAGSIVGKMILEKKDWNASAKSVESDTKNMGKWSEASSQKFQKMGRTMTLAGAAIVGALGLMVRNFVKTGDWIDKMSKRTGISATALSELAHAAEISGASLEDIEKATKRMAGTILDANDGVANSVRAFENMGLSIDELMAGNPEQQFLAIGEAIAELEDPTMRAAIAQDVFGRAGTTLLPLFTEGAEGIRKLRQEAHDLGIVFDEEAAAKAANLLDAQTNLTASVQGLGKSIAFELSPHITSVVKAITGAISEFSKWSDSIPGLKSGLALVTAAVGGFLLVGGPMIAMLPRMIEGFGILKLKAVTLAPALARIGVAGAGAFIGWKIGRLIGELTGLDTKIEGLATKVINKFGLWQGATESVVTSTRILAKRQKLLADASEKAGVKITEQRIALKILKGTHELVNGELVRVGVSYDNVNQKSDAWTKSLKDRGIPTTEEYRASLEKIKKEKQFLHQALQDGAIHYNTYTEEVAKLDAEVKKLTESTVVNKEEQALWLEFMRTQGFSTVAEKTARVGQLERIIKGLNSAYRSGKIDLTTYTNAMSAASLELSNMSTTMLETAIPAQREMSDVQQQAVDTMIEAPVKWEESMVQSTEKVSETFSQFTESLSSKWSSTINTWLSGATTFKDFMKGIWGDVLSSFTEMLAEMATRWAVDFVAEILSGAESAGGGIVSSVGSAISNVAGGVTEVASSVTSALTGGLATAVGSAVGSFLGTMLSASTQEKLLRDLKEISHDSKMNLIWLVAGGNSQREKLDKIFGRTHGSMIRLQIIKDLAGRRNRILKRIVQAIDETNKILRKKKGAQGGAVFNSPDFAFLHGSPTNPEFAIPADRLEQMMNAPGAPANQQPMSFSPTVNLNGTMVTDRDWTRDRLFPEMIAALKANFNKTQMRNSMGVT